MIYLYIYLYIAMVNFAAMNIDDSKTWPANMLMSATWIFFLPLRILFNIWTGGKK